MNLYVHTIIAVMVMCTLRVDAQRIVVDPAIAEQAQAAVQKLGIELMKGNFTVQPRAHVSTLEKTIGKARRQHGGA